MKKQIASTKSEAVKNKKTSIKSPIRKSSAKVSTKQAILSVKAVAKSPAKPVIRSTKRAGSVQAEKVGINKVAAIKRTASNRNSIINLKKTSPAREKIENILQTGRRSVADPVISKRGVSGRPMFKESFLKDDIVIRETEMFVPEKNTARRKVIFLAIAIIVFAGLFSLVAKYKAADQATVKKASVANGDVVVAVGKIIDLPQDENPTVATVTNGDKFSRRNFFSKAESGDKILIYAKSSMAILYRPAANKIVEVAHLIRPEELADLKATRPTSVPSPVAVASAASTSIQGEVSVAVYNGSKTKGLAALIANRLAEIKGINIVKKSNAVGNFDKTIIVDLTGKNTEAVKIIALAMNGSVIASLPEGEVSPKADILVIAADSVLAPSL